MRVAVIHIGQETDTFNPRFTTWEDFESFGIYRGAEVFEHMRGLGQVGGYLDVAEARGSEVESIPIIRGWAGAGGRIDRASHEAFLDEIRDGLRTAGPIDGVAMQLHGACSADGEDDVEGAQLAACREIIGDDVAVVLSLDHHANITTRMVELSTAIVGHRTQPHDPFDTGRIAAELLFGIIDGDVDPVMAWRKLPLLSHQEQYLTSQGPMKTWFDRARAAEADQAEVLAVSNFPMQPWLDVSEGGWATVVVTNGARRVAEDLADELGDLAWSMREEFQVRTSVGVDEALTDAVATEGMVLLSDTGDSVFGGAAGDSNVILEAALRLGIDKTILIPLVSPDVVAALWEAGEGATVTLPVGGDTTPFYEPLEATGVVQRLRSGPVDVIEHSQRSVDMGRTAIFEVGPALLLVSELRGLGGNVPEVYQACGVEPQEHGIVVLKTASNFQYFRPMATKVIRVDTPGPTQSGIVDLPWERVPRPIFPLDEMTSWRT
ncbi:MAG: M81 family metallopeptidase [Acidimicrobiia bacterium]